MPIVTFSPSADEQHLVQHDLGADVCRDLFYFQFFAGADAVLLAAGFYDRIHDEPRLNCVLGKPRILQKAQRSSQSIISGVTPRVRPVFQGLSRIAAVAARPARLGVVTCYHPLPFSPP